MQISIIAAMSKGKVELKRQPKIILARAGQIGEDEAYCFELKSLLHNGASLTDDHNR
jgi:hypothetical protein